jgi:hypothetical protein
MDIQSIPAATKVLLTRNQTAKSAAVLDIHLQTFASALQAAHRQALPLHLIATDTSLLLPHIGLH